MKNIKTPQRIHLLGSLEKEIMEVCWHVPHATVRDVMSVIQRKRPIAYTTVMTVMDRLYKKGVLKRTVVEHAYRYRPAHDRASFARRAAANVAKSFIAQFGDVGIAQFVDVLEDIDPKKLRALRNKIQKAKS